MRKLLILCVLLVLAVSPALAQKGIISIGDYTANPGDTISVDIMMDENVKNVAGIQLTVEFRESTVAGAPPLVALENPQKPGTGEADLTRGPKVPAGAFVLGNAKVAGELKVGVVGTEGFSGPGPLITFKLNIPANAPQGAKYTLHLKDVVVNDPDVNPIDVALKDGSVAIPAPPPPPSANILLLGTHVLRPGVPRTVAFQITKPEKAAGAEFVVEYDPAFVSFDANSVKAGGALDPATALAVANPNFEDPEGKIKPSDPANKLMKVAVASANPMSEGTLLTIAATVTETIAPWQSRSLTVVADTLKFRDVEGAEIPGASAGPGVLVSGSKTSGWSLQIGAPVSSSVSSAGDRIVVVGDDGKAFVLNIADGSSAVKTSPTLPGAVEGRPVIAGGWVSIETVGDKTVVTLRDAGVFAATRAGDVVAFNLDDGSERFAPVKFAEGAKVVPGFFPDKGAVLYAADDAKVTVLDQSGAQIASVPLDANLGTITAPPVFAFGKLWLGTSTGNIVALEPKDGTLQPVVNFSTGNAPIIAAPFAYLEDLADPNSLNLVVANQGGTVFKISASGEEKAKLIPDAAEKVSSAPFVLGDKVFVLYDSGELYIANLSNLSVVSKVKVASAVGANQSVAVFGSTLYVGDQNGKFHAVNIADPANPKITTVDLLSGAVSSPAVGGLIEVIDGKAQLRDLQVVVATANGTIVALPLL
ncbi:MAG: PQQ-binding-like beta-propeller repeat protein [Armatimonadota bacterium]